MGKGFGTKVTEAVSKGFPDAGRLKVKSRPLSSPFKGAVAAVGVDRLDFAVGVDVVFIFAVTVVVCDMLVPLAQIVGGVAVGALFVAVALRIVGKAYNAAVASNLCRFVEPVVAYLYAVVVGHVAVSVVRIVSVARVCDRVDVGRVGYRFMRKLGFSA